MRLPKGMSPMSIDQQMWGIHEWSSGAGSGNKSLPKTGSEPPK